MRSIRRLPGLAGWASAALLFASGAVQAEGRVHPTAEAVEPLAAGASVPSARVQTIAGDPVDLAALVRDRGALLVFYRGGW